MVSHQGAPTPQFQPALGRMQGVPSLVVPSGLSARPTHPSKEYLLVLGMSMMSMKPRFPAGRGVGAWRGGGSPPAAAGESGHPEALSSPRSPAEPATMALSFLLCLERSRGTMREAGPLEPTALPAPRSGHSHGPVVPVHEDEQHGRQEEQDGQDDDRHLGGRPGMSRGLRGRAGPRKDGPRGTCRADMSSGSRTEMAGCTSRTL